LSSAVIYLVYALPLLLLYYFVSRKRRVLEATSSETWNEALASGMTQPPSLHPVIDPTRCIGCESCIHACPEFPAHQVLGIIKHKAVLVSPTDCIGHGACKTVCPVDAISLVFGTAERGVDIPEVNPDFSTNVPGIFIAGELGGMGLIRNAINQGREAIAGVARYVGDSGQMTNTEGSEKTVDVCIIGAGPAGIAATLGAKEAGLSYVTLEQDKLGGTVANFPRGKLVMTAPAELPGVGTMYFQETSKEQLVEFWNDIARRSAMQVNYGERLVSVETQPERSLSVVSDQTSYRVRAVLLAIGRRGTPRKLGVSGEELSKVTYAFTDPEQYRGSNVLVVGGGDSAIEAACSIVEETGARVALSYRSAAFTRAKAKNRLRLEKLSSAGQLTLLLETEVVAISQESVTLKGKEGNLQIDNDAVLVCAGGILPDSMLREMGIKVEAKYGTA
jgi:thioredoxin reductase (NADPH)